MPSQSIIHKPTESRAQDATPAGLANTADVNGHDQRQSIPTRSILVILLIIFELPNN